MTRESEGTVSAELGAGTSTRSVGQSSTATIERPTLRVDDLALGFGQKTVLEGVDLAFHPGEMTALIGPTGCGKSTLLRTLNRMNDKVRGFWRRGTIDLDGMDIYGSSAIRCSCASASGWCSSVRILSPCRSGTTWSPA